MVPSPDIAKAFQEAWAAECRDERVHLGTATIPGIEIRRFATAFAGSTQWKCVDKNASDDQLFLLGMDIARARFRGSGSIDLFSLEMGRFDKADLVELGRIAYNAVHGPSHPVLQALSRRFRA